MPDWFTVLKLLVVFIVFLASTVLLCENQLGSLNYRPRYSVLMNLLQEEERKKEQEQLCILVIFRIAFQGEALDTMESLTASLSHKNVIQEFKQAAD